MNYQDHATAVTGRLVEMIRTESHDTWAMPWHTHDLGDLLNARNATTDTRYNGANVITLALEALDRGYFHRGMGHLQAMGRARRPGPQRRTIRPGHQMGHPQDHRERPDLRRPR